MESQILEQKIEETNAVTFEIKLKERIIVTLSLSEVMDLFCPGGLDNDQRYKMLEYLIEKIEENREEKIWSLK